MAHHELLAWSRQMVRVERDLDAAVELLDSASRLLDRYSEAQTSLLTAGPGGPAPRLRAQVLDLEASFAASLEATADARREGRSYSAILQLPRARDLVDRMEQLEDRMLTASDVGYQVSGLLAELVDLADGARPLMGQFVVNGAEPEPWTTETLRATLTSVNERTLSARSRVEKVSGLIAATDQSEQLLVRLEALEQVLVVLVAVNRAGIAGLNVIEPTAASMERSSGGLLTGGGGLLEIFDAFVENHQEVEDAVAELERAQAIIRELESDNSLGVAGRLSDISEFVTDLRSGLEFADRIAPMGRSLLAAGGVRRYLVLGQSADELRGTGGFVSGLWLITVQNGELTDIRYHDSVRVDD